MSKIFISNTENTSIITFPKKINNHFAGTTDVDLYIDNCLRFFWNGNSITPWFKIEALAAGKFAFGSFLLKSGSNEEYKSLVDPVVVNDEYFLSNDAVTVPNFIFNTDEYNIYTISLGYSPNLGEDCSYDIICKSLSGFTPSTNDTLGVITQSFTGDTA